MNTDTLIQAGLTELQAKIYLFLIKTGENTPTEIAKSIEENRTTVYSAAEKLATMGLITKKERGKITAYTPNHPSVLEELAEKRLRRAARQAKNLESSLPYLINFYHAHQHKPGVTTFYGKEGIEKIWEKSLSEKGTYYFIRSRHDVVDPDALERFKAARNKAKLHSESLSPSEFIDVDNSYSKREWNLERTLLPPAEYDSPVEITIFGNYVAFINYSADGMSTLIESPEIADAMRQVFLFSKKYIRKATNQSELDYKGQDSKESTPDIKIDPLKPDPDIKLA